jgi:HAD superfamily phosphatase (TIGR01668 family)
MKHLHDSKTRRNYWLPNYRAPRVIDIDFTVLAKRNIRNIAIDIDGTLVSGIYDKSVSQEYIEYLHDARQTNNIRRLVIATNRMNGGIQDIAKELNADATINANLFSRKPMKSYYKRLLKTIEAPAEETIMIGDRLWQDILGANSVGMHTLLVEDFGPPEWYDSLLGRRWRQRRRMNRLNLPKL